MKRRILRSYQKIGLRLRQARVNHHYSLDYLHNTTKIQKKYLVDIEQGHFKKLPGAFYTRAFIHKYANKVGINGNELLKKNNDKLPDVKDPRFIRRISHNSLAQNVNQHRITEHHFIVKRYLPLISTLIIVVSVLVGIWSITLDQKNEFHNNYLTDTSISGNKYDGNSSVKFMKDRRSRVKKSAIKSINIKKIASRGIRSTYQISGLRNNSSLHINGLTPTWIVIKMNRRRSRFSLNLHQKRVVELTPRSKKVILVLGNAPQTKIRINKQILRSDLKSRFQIITLKIR